MEKSPISQFNPEKLGFARSLGAKSTNFVNASC